MSPHFEGTSDDYAREEVLVAVAMNGQDFNEIESTATIAFIGTGSDGTFLHFLVLLLLLTLLCVALAVVFLAY